MKTLELGLSDFKIFFPDLYGDSISMYGRFIFVYVFIQGTIFESDFKFSRFMKNLVFYIIACLLQYHYICLHCSELFVCWWLEIHSLERTCFWSISFWSRSMLKLLIHLEGGGVYSKCLLWLWSCNANYEWLMYYYDENNIYVNTMNILWTC